MARVRARGEREERAPSLIVKRAGSEGSKGGGTRKQVFVFVRPDPRLRSFFRPGGGREGPAPPLRQEVRVRAEGEGSRNFRKKPREEFVSPRPHRGGGFPGMTVYN